MTDKTEAQPEALRLAEALLEQAEHHRDLAHCCDCRPEDTVNWDHFLQCGNAATELRRLYAETEAKAARIAELEAQLSARQAAPDGWRLVPVEPTEEMVAAAEEAHMPFGDMQLAIQSALSASPTPPQREPIPPDLSNVDGINARINFRRGWAGAEAALGIKGEEDAD